MDNKPDIYHIEPIGHQLGCWTGIEASLYSVNDRFYRTDVYYSTEGTFKREVEIFSILDYNEAVQYYNDKIKEYKTHFEAQQ